MADPKHKADTKTEHAQGEGVPLRIIIDDENAPERIYANHIRVAHTAFDFTLDFCDLGPLSTASVQEYDDHAEVYINPKVRIALTKEVAEALIEALRKNLKLYYDHMGEK